jgi:hypothetical protein
VRNAATQPIKHLLVRAELTLRAALRVFATRRLDRLYGDLPPRPSAPRKDAQSQAAALAGIVQTHCAAGTAIFETHSAAAMKLDTAEYALSMMLAELRDVMVAPQTSWAPARKAIIPQFTRVADAAAQAA